MKVDCVIEDDRWVELDLDKIAQRAAVAAMEHLDFESSDFEISLLACDDTRISALNADFRAKPTATNVLSWPSAERAAEIDGNMPLKPERGMDSELGDIAISYDTCAREAAETGKTMVDHTTHLLVHGTLHLLGFDHERDRDATLMEDLETEILGKLGIADPYKE